MAHLERTASPSTIHPSPPLCEHDRGLMVCAHMGDVFACAGWTLMGEGGSAFPECAFVRRGIKGGGGMMAASASWPPSGYGGWGEYWLWGYRAMVER